MSIFVIDERDISKQCITPESLAGQNNSNMITLESLNRDYERISNWQEQYRRTLLDYLNKGLEFCGGAASIEVKHRHYSDAEDAGVDFDDQFPVSVDIEDRHSFHHEIYVTRFYRQGDLFYVDGYDRTDGKWVEGWYTDDRNDTYESLAYLLDAALNPEVDEETESAVAGKDFTSSVIGWQVVDQDRNYPSELGCWDVFRTKEDADAYIQDQLDPDEWQAVEEWSTSHDSVSMYHFIERTERTFNQREMVWLADGQDDRTVAVSRTTSVRWSNEKVKVHEVNTGEEWIDNWVVAGELYQLAGDKRCPKCGNPLYAEHHPELDYPYYCPECDENFYDIETE